MRIFCIGRNYAAHAAELGNQVPGNPVVFMKPESALLQSPCAFQYPTFSSEIHHELELVFRIGAPLSQIQEADGWGVIDGIGLGLDLTARDIQNECKDKGLPWELAKAFDHSAPISDILSMASYSGKHEFSLRKNGEVMQKGDSSNMIFAVPALVSFISKYFTLMPGDLLFTGSPKGVGPITPGDMLEGDLEGETILSCQIK